MALRIRKAQRLMCFELWKNGLLIKWPTLFTFVYFTPNRTCSTTWCRISSEPFRLVLLMLLVLVSSIPGSLVNNNVHFRGFMERLSLSKLFQGNFQRITRISRTFEWDYRGFRGVSSGFFLKGSHELDGVQR